MNKDFKEVVNLCYTDKYEMNDLEERRLFINDNIDSEIVDTIVYHILRSIVKIKIHQLKIENLYYCT